MKQLARKPSPILSHLKKKKLKQALGPPIAKTKLYCASPSDFSLGIVESFAAVIGAWVSLFRF
jgi:hypothetical protein